MPARLKLTVAYDGSGFGGWQSQSHRNTIQDQLERAFQRVTSKELRIHGAGRTDAGVHAFAQCAHVDLADRRLSSAKWIAALNANLPPTIRIMRCAYVPQSFHARHSAKSKLYRYRIWAAQVLPPLEFERAWHVASPLNLSLIKAAARKFIGSHDFAGFAANRGKPVENTVRTINSVRIRKEGPCITIDFEGDGFLYKMVRLMVGTLVQCGLGKMRADEIISRLNSAPPNATGYAAPAAGLFLLRVRY
jgi:tRNA pseudouridine38-40 synthase